MANTWIKTTLSKIVSTVTTQNPSFESEFSTLTTNADRVQFCLSEEVIQGWICLFLKKFETNKSSLKCSKTAAKHREKGNDCFRVGNYQQAIELYSTAIRFAPQSMDITSEVALAYGNRSAAYFQAGQHDNALKDIDAALAFGYARFKPVIKLQLRKCDCLIRLGRASEAKEFLMFMQQPTEEENDSNRWIELFDRISLNDKKNEPSKEKISLLEKLTQNGFFKSNDKMKLLSAKVAVCYDAEKGRHLVAQENIQFGDILGISRPYVTVFDSKDDAGKCHHCCRDLFLGDMVAASLRPVPCNSCSSVMYCSEECRAESSNSYHRYECGQHGLLSQLPKYVQLALRILYRAGMDQIRSVVSDEQAKDSSYFSEQPEDHYSHVYHLVHHSDGLLKNRSLSFTEMLDSSIFACLLLQLVKLGNGHFPMNTKEDQKLVGGLLLRHLHQLRCNVFEYYPLNRASSSSFPILLDLYPVYASTLNHSCRANSRLESRPNEYVCFLQAAQPISAGTEITISYFNDTADDYIGNQGVSSVIELANKLSRYGFHCNCAQCKYHLRNMPFGVFGYVPLSCSDCGHLIEHFSEQSSESEVFRCTNCPLEMTNAEVKRRYHQHDQLRSLIRPLIDQIDALLICEQKSIFRQLESTTERLESLLHHDSAMMIGFIRYTISMHYLVNGQLDKWWACIEQFFSVIEHLFGAESVRFIQEFDRIQESQVEPMDKAQSYMMMEYFKQENNKSYERYLARVEQWKQLKLKYYAGY